MQTFSLFLPFVLLVTSTCFVSVNGFLWDKELEIIKSEWSPVVVVVRHVEYIGGKDNGTLDCSVPGFTKYRWTVINKATKDGFTESYVLGTGSRKIPESQSHMKIGEGGFNLLNDLLIVSCEALLDLNPRMQIIWAITRLHSPMGYPTDPRVCDFGSKNLETNCLWYKWTYKKDCYYDKGLDYTGSVNMAKDKKCKYWHMNTGPHKRSHVIARLMGIFDKGGHDYCRNIPWNPTCYLKRGDHYSCKQNLLTQPWCYSDDDPDEDEFKVHYCNVPECSSCMYGNGDGSFKLYPGRKFPEYLGRSIVTTRIVKSNPVLCLQGIGWRDNVCRTKLSIQTDHMGSPYVVTKATPHCFVAKTGVDKNKIKVVPDEDLQLVECKLRQCTVRQVWFLFFNTYGKPFLVESNFDGIKIELVRGRKEERIKFAAFGIHLISGLTIGSSDNRVTSHLDNFSLVTRRPPDSLSEVVIKNIRREYSGKYQLQYKFAEADDTVDQGLYKVNFEIDVKEPTLFSLNPSILKVCSAGEGKISVQVKGYFEVLEDTIKWKYGLSRRSIKSEILPQNTRFELDADAKGLSIKRVTEELWVSVEGRSYSGKPLAIAHVTLKDQPFLKRVSPTTQYAFPGDDVSLIIESDQLQKVTWTFDAMVISSLPDDPNMGFRRVPRGDHVVTSLVISDVREHHYGSYYVETVLDGCKTVVKFDVKHSSEKPEDRLSPEISDESVDFNRTGLWCTDELDPYAFYFRVDLGTITTIGAFSNEPLTETNEVEVQHYSIHYSMDDKLWKTLTLKKNNSRIPYTLFGNKIHWLQEPFKSRYLKIYPERTTITACMKVRMFGCKGDNLDCDVIKRLGSTTENLGLIVGIAASLVALVILGLVILIIRKRCEKKEEKERKMKKRKQEKRKRNREFFVKENSRKNKSSRKQRKKDNSDSIDDTFKDKRKMKESVKSGYEYYWDSESESEDEKRMRSKEKRQHENEKEGKRLRKHEKQKAKGRDSNLKVKRIYEKENERKKDEKRIMKKCKGEYKDFGQKEKRNRKGKYNKHHKEDYQSSTYRQADRSRGFYTSCSSSSEDYSSIKRRRYSYSGSEESDGYL